MKPPYRTTILKVFLSLMIPIVLGAICSSMGNWNREEVAYYNIKLGLIILLGLVYFIAAIYYAVTEINVNKENSLLKVQNKIYSNLLGTIMTECQFSANGTNMVIHSIKEKRVANLRLWNFEDECKRLVGHIYTLLKELGEGDDYEVLYDKLDEEDPSKQSVVTVAYKNKRMLRPSVYNIKREINGEETNTEFYHDLVLFCESKNEIDILVNEQAIDEAFGYRTKEQRNKNKDKYSQYIGIPVFCDEKKMIGLIQIVCLNKTKLGNTIEEIDDIVSRYIIPYSFLALVFHKMEKALITKPQGKEEMVK